MTPLLLMLVLQAPTDLYQAKFVPFRGRQGDDLDIRDARRDLSAIGFSVSSGGDWVVPWSLYVIKGVHKGPEEDNSPIWRPYALVKGDHVLTKNEKGQSALFQVQAKGLARLRSTEQAKPTPRIASTEVTEIPFREEWRPEKLVSKELTVNWYKLGQWDIGSASYQYGEETMLYSRPEKHLALLRRDGDVQRLGDRVRGAEDILLGEVGFVSEDGWLVVRGTRKGKDGLVWLYPLPKSNGIVTLPTSPLLPLSSIPFSPTL